MDRKTLEHIYEYLPVVIATSDRVNYTCGKDAVIPLGVISDVREFFDYLRAKIPLAKIPDPEELTGDSQGNLVILWETDVDPDSLKHDSFTISFTGHQYISYEGRLESLDTKTLGCIDLTKELDQYIIEHLEFFYGKQNEK